MPASRSEPRRAKPAFVSKHLEAFLEMLAAERGAARLTLAAYRNDLIDLAGFLAAQGTTLEAADADALHAYLATTSGRLTPRSLARPCFRDASVLQVPGDRRGSPGRSVERARCPTLGPAAAESVPRRRGRAADRRRPQHRRRRGRAAPLHCRTSLCERAAGVRTGRPAARCGIARPAVSADPRQGRQGARCAAERARSSRADAISRLPGPVFAEGGSLALAVSVARRKRPSDAAALRPIAEGAGGGRRDRPRPAVAACAAPRLRQPSARSRRRSAQRAADARTCRHRDDADLHACAGRPPAASWWKPPIRWRAASNASFSRFRAADRRTRRQDRRVAPSGHDRRTQHRRRGRPPRTIRRSPAAPDLRAPDAVAEGRRGAPSGAAARPRLHQAD